MCWQAALHSDCCYYTKAWNPATEDQCFDRCHRLGQTRDVVVTKVWFLVSSLRSFTVHVKPIQLVHTLTFNGPLSETTRVSWYQIGKTNLDFTETRDSAWQWHQLGHMQVCTSLQTDNHASTPPLSFLQAGCPSCRPTNSVKALMAIQLIQLLLFHLKRNGKSNLCIICHLSKAAQNIIN